MIVDMLNFREEARSRIIPFIKEQFPSLVSNYKELYTTNYCDKEYAKQVRKYSNKLVKKYNVDKYDKMFSYHKSKS